jgi:hypothetical protein
MFRDDLQYVLKYIRNTWGLFSGASVLFPAANLLMKAIPTSVFEKYSPDTILTSQFLTGVATVTSISAMMLALSTRQKYLFAMKRDVAAAKLLERAIRMFMCAPIPLLLYIAMYSPVPRSQADLEDPRLIAFTTACFALTFAFLTAGFTRLGLREYLLNEMPLP